MKSGRQRPVMDSDLGLGSALRTHIAHQGIDRPNTSATNQPQQQIGKKDNIQTEFALKKEENDICNRHIQPTGQRPIQPAALLDRTCAQEARQTGANGFDGRIENADAIRFQNIPLQEESQNEYEYHRSDTGEDGGPHT